MHISNIAVVVSNGNGNRNYGQAMVTVVDANGQPVSGATVSGTFTGDSANAPNGITNASGQVTLSSPVNKNGSTWTFCVTGITKSGWTYNSSANLETCDNTGGLPTPTPTFTPGPTATPTATPGGGSTILHVGDLDGSSASSGSRWDASVVLTLHDGTENPIAGATISGLWSNGASGSGSCVTDANGQCSISKLGLRNSISSISFTVTSVTKSGYTYQAGSNHDPDGDSNGTAIVVNKP
jgi:hypothetical protein